MNIPSKLWSRWTDLYSPGDAAKIAAMAKCHPNTVLNAIRNGRTNPDVFAALTDFYDNRQSLINKATQQ